MKTAEELLQALCPDESLSTPPYLQLARNLKSAIHSRQWKAEEALPSHNELIRLGLLSNEKVVCMKHLRKADDTVMAIENSTLPARLLRDPAAVGDSLYAYLDASGQPVIRTLQHVRAITPLLRKLRWPACSPERRCCW